MTINWWNNLPWKVRRRLRQRDTAYAIVGLDQVQVDRLAIYNAEVDRGIIHAADYAAAMAEIQDRYIQMRRARP